MNYRFNSIDTSKIRLPDDLRQLMERLAEHNHDVWTRQRISDGWIYGNVRNDEAKTHPGLVPYSELPEFEKDYDRNTATEVLKAIVALGYKIEKE